MSLSQKVPTYARCSHICTHMQSNRFLDSLLPGLAESQHRDKRKWMGVGGWFGLIFISAIRSRGEQNRCVHLPEIEG